MYSIVMLTALSAGADVTPPPAAVAAPVVGSGGNGVVMTGYTGSCYGFSYQGHHRASFYGIYPHTYFTSLGYSLAGTCHGGALVIYGPVGVPPATPYGFHTGLAPVWGTGPPVVFGRLVDSPVVPGNSDSSNKPPEMTVPVPPMTKPGSDTSPMGANLKFQVPADAKLYVGGKLAPGTGTCVHHPAAAGRAEVLLRGEGRTRCGRQDGRRGEDGGRGGRRGPDRGVPGADRRRREAGRRRRAVARGPRTAAGPTPASMECGRFAGRG